MHSSKQLQPQSVRKSWTWRCSNTNHSVISFSYVSALFVFRTFVCVSVNVLLSDILHPAKSWVLTINKLISFVNFFSQCLGNKHITGRNAFMMIFIHGSKCIENEQVLVKTGNKQVNFFKPNRYRAKRKLIEPGLDIIFMSWTLHSLTKFL